MKIKNHVLLDTHFVDALMMFINLPLPAKASYPLSKCIKIFEKEEISVKTARNNLIKKYGESTFYTDSDIIPEGMSVGSQKGWDISKSSITNQQLYSEEFKKLMETEFEIEIDEKINISIDDISKIEVSAEHIDKISIIVDFKD